MKLSLNAPAPLHHTLISAVAFLMIASSLGAQAPVRYSGRDVHLRIETDRRTYRVGDVISVRLTLRNLSSHPVQFIAFSPEVQAHLLVYDAAGQKIEPTFDGGSQRSLVGRLVTLQSGGERILKWESREWLDLRDWGYDLQAPGQYGIVGLPVVGGPELTTDVKTVRSNRATLTIKP